MCLLVTMEIFSNDLRIVTTVEPPTNYYIDNEIFSGTTTDIIIEMKRYLKLETDIEVLPWARAYAYSLKKPDIVIYTCGKTQERIDHGFHFIGPVITRKHILWSIKGKNININSIKDIKEQNLEITGMRGDWRSEFFSKQGIKVYTVSDHEYSLEILLKGRIDLWISSDIEAPEVAKIVGIDMSELEAVYVFREAPSYIMLSRDSSLENIQQWRSAFMELQKTDFFKKLSGKWSNILGYSIDYDDEKGLFVK